MAEIAFLCSLARCSDSKKIERIEDRKRSSRIHQSDSIYFGDQSRLKFTRIRRTPISFNSVPERLKILKQDRNNQKKIEQNRKRTKSKEIEACQISCFNPLRSPKWIESNRQIQFDLFLSFRSFLTHYAWSLSNWFYHKVAQSEHVWDLFFQHVTSEKKFRCASLTPNAWDLRGLSMDPYWPLLLVIVFIGEKYYSVTLIFDQDALSLNGSWVDFEKLYKARISSPLEHLVAAFRTLVLPVDRLLIWLQAECRPGGFYDWLTLWPASTISFEKWHHRRQENW